YIPAILLRDFHALKVSRIIVAGHNPTPITTNGNIFVNHGVICLELKQGSIRLNISPHTTAGERGTL
ncbi:hypothetical protein IQ07DRAFT_489201, partial [Pyrenochaeta sp. DS3sAY3a]